MPQSDLDTIIRDMEKAAQLLRKKSSDVSSPKRDKPGFDAKVVKVPESEEGVDPVEGAGSSSEEEKKKEAEKLANEILRTFKGANIKEAFRNGIRSQGAPFLQKVSGVVDPNMSEGAHYVRMVLQKVAADVAQYAPTLQRMFADGKISEEEKAKIMDVLTSTEAITKEVLMDATNGIQNQDAIVSELLKLLEGENPPMEVGAPVTQQTAEKEVQAAIRKLYRR